MRILVGWQNIKMLLKSDEIFVEYTDMISIINRAPKLFKFGTCH